MWELIGLPIAVFVLKVVELTVSTIRTILAVSAMGKQAAVVGFIEATIGVAAIGAVVTHLGNPFAILGYAAGFSVGIVAGTKVEEWLALGLRLVQIVNPDPVVPLAAQLRSRGYRVTSLPGVGRSGAVEIGLILVRRRSLPMLLSIISTLAPRAFITVQRSERSIGGSFMSERPWWDWFRRAT